MNELQWAGHILFNYCIYSPTLDKITQPLCIPQQKWKKNKNFKVPSLRQSPNIMTKFSKLKWINKVEILGIKPPYFARLPKIKMFASRTTATHSTISLKIKLSSAVRLFFCQTFQFSRGLLKPIKSCLIKTPHACGQLTIPGTNAPWLYCTKKGFFSPFILQVANLLAISRDPRSSYGKIAYIQLNNLFAILKPSK